MFMRELANCARAKARFFLPQFHRPEGRCSHKTSIFGAPGYPTDMEIIFEVRDAEEGGYFARALSHSIFTEAESLEGLRSAVLEAAALHFEGMNHASIVQLRHA